MYQHFVLALFISAVNGDMFLYMTCLPLMHDGGLLSCCPLCISHVPSYYHVVYADGSTLRQCASYQFQEHTVVSLVQST
jgi:hypothetical protein